MKLLWLIIYIYSFTRLILLFHIQNEEIYVHILSNIYI